MIPSGGSIPADTPLKARVRSPVAKPMMMAKSPQVARNVSANISKVIQPSGRFWIHSLIFSS